METTSAGIIDRRTAVANNLHTGAVKVIKIIFKQKRNVETRVDHKLHKRFVTFQKLKDPVWGHSRAGTSITITVSAENSFTVDVRETKTVSSIKLRVKGSVVRA